VTDGPTGLAHILAQGGSGYFPTAMVGNHIDAGRLFAVPMAPVFAYPLFAVLTPSLAEQTWFSEAARRVPAGPSPRFVPDR
jgi:hypothetical protein